MYDYIIVTHIPVFYKINLYNEIAEHKNILVLFLSSDTVEVRADDFITLNDTKFDYEILSSQSLQNRSTHRNILKIRKIINRIDYKKLLVGGWDLVEFWYIAFFINHKHLALSLESTVIESRTSGLKGIIKKIFLSRVSTVFASGRFQVELLQKLKYKNNIKITHGVGIINKPDQKYEQKAYGKKFIYIGRLSKEKNIRALILIFNELKGFHLTIIGDGEEKQRLMDTANQNISFKGKINNKYLLKEFRENDILILPSIIEPWGLVVEEALYFGLPVLVSQNCGSSALVRDAQNGFTFNPNDHENIRELLISINKTTFEKLMANNGRDLVDSKDIQQITCYD